ncbi:hypothetical protein TNCT_306611 [Trichonephila clavata]|uniref:Uncharacterized protein n=1 Tax=Trichonephila clavata TaxID=2740835 RepID=A0A8X6FNY4_TRICU|nr:hypothetical protein TNCT_306611 [Trichonephila clavata]
MSDGSKRQENPLTDYSLMMSSELNDEQKSQIAEVLGTLSGVFTKTDKSTTTDTNVKHRIQSTKGPTEFRRRKDVSFVMKCRKCLRKV